MGLAVSAASAAATMVCQCACCCAYCIANEICNCTLGHATKVGHALVVIFTYGLSMILALELPDNIDKIPYSKIGNTCESGEYHDDCLGNQVLYRSSVGLVMTFIVMIFCVGFNDTADKSYWPFKFTLPISISLLFWYCDDEFFNGFAEVARVLSFFWLLFQSLLMFDFAYDFHEVMSAQTDDNTETCLCLTNGCRAKAIYLFIAIGCQVAGFAGIAVLYTDDAGPTDQFLISLTLIVGVLTTIACSVSDKIAIGFMPPSIMFAYTTFILAYAISDQHKLLGIVIFVTIFLMIWCAYYGTRILNLFLPDGSSMMSDNYTAASTGGGSMDPKLSSMLTGGNTSVNATTTSTTVTTSQPSSSGVQTSPSSTPSTSESSVLEGSTGPPVERVFFHLLMLLVSCYGVMVLTEWDRTNGEPTDEGNSSVAAETLWLKVVSQWVFFIMFLRTIQMKYAEES